MSLLLMLYGLPCRYGHFSGINRKVQLTYLPNGQLKASSEEEGMLVLSTCERINGFSVQNIVPMILK